ncbi:MAG: prolyl oligopeptidase family serine peptidase [Povalibacter sp.]
MKFGTPLLVAFTAISALAGHDVYAAETGDSIEPPLRELWTRGSERFQRQWLIAGPVDARTAASIDPASLQPALRQPLAQGSDVLWSMQTTWSDVTDLSVVGGRKPDLDGKPVDRFVFVAGALSFAKPGPADIAVGSERAYSLWLNGKLIQTRDQAQTFLADQDRIPVELQSGSNVIVMRFHETSAGPSSFTVRTLARGAALSTTLGLAPSIASSEQNELAVKTHLVAEKGPPVLLEVIAAAGEIVAKQNVARGEVARFDSSRWHDGAYEVRLSTQDAWGVAHRQYLPWYKGDALAAVRSLVAASEQAQSGPRGDSLRMLAAMAKARLGGSLDVKASDAWRQVHSPLMEFEELQLEAQGKAGAVHPAGFVRIAYTDEIDGSTQYCRTFLPTDYSAAKPTPLIVFLHGFNPANPEYFDWWDADHRHNSIADSRDTIVIEAHARGNAQYVGIGDRDVMRCIDEAKRRLNVDADRVYLTGESMGGHGTWAIATRHPDVFAAAAPVYGGWDLRVTSVSGPSNAPTTMNALQAYSFERMSSFSNAENLLHVPLLITHGDGDPSVSVENSRHAVRMLQRWGYDVRYHEMPGWAHEDLGRRELIADWLLTHKRDLAPRTVRLRSTELAGASAYWIDVQALERPAEVIRVDAEVLEPGVVRVDSTNVAMLALNLPPALRGSDTKVDVIWNGERQSTQMNEGRVKLGTVAATGLHKRRGLEGPIPAVIATPFAVVVGTISKDARMREMIQQQADYLAQQWQIWQHQSLRVIKDADLTPNDEKSYSLVLMGGADANAVTRRLAKKLPFSASAQSISVDGHSWPLKDAVLQAIYPSPMAADRYVYAVLPTSADGLYFWKPQFVHFTQGGFPLTMFDWLIQDGRRPPPGTFDMSDSFVASGMFDINWRRQDRWSKQRDESKASGWTLRHAPSKDLVVADAVLQQIAGQYELFPGFVVTVKTADSKLVVDAPGEPSLTLISESDSIFLNPRTGDVAEVLRDAQGKITGLSVDNQNAIIMVKRTQ